MISYFSYYEYKMRCPSLKIETTRKDTDFYFLRDKLKKLYPATVVSINKNINKLYQNKISFCRSHLYQKMFYLNIIGKVQMIKE